MMDANPTAVLRASLAAQGAVYPVELRDIEISLAALELRRAYALMSRLKERGLWTPEAAALQALEDFWWEYAQ